MVEASLPARAGQRVIRGYQFLWAGTTPRCRFAPTCSHYAHDAIGTFGLGRGLWMAMKRIGRCHPWHPGGYDPVVDPNIHSVSGR